MSHSIHWLNNSGVNVVCSVYHDIIKRRYFSVPCKAGATAKPYTPFIQSMYYTIRIYDEEDKNRLCEYQYVCVEKNNYLVNIESVNNQIQIFISYYPVLNNDKRPVYMIGGQCNNIEDINKALNKGTNGIECDIWSDEDEWWVNHYANKDLTLDKWLKKASGAALKYGDEFAVIIFDIKTAQHLNKLQEKITRCLPTDLNIIFSVSDIEKAVAFETITSQLLPNQSLAIDEVNNVEAVVEFFESINVKQFWYGNGIFSGGLDTENQHESLRLAGKMRDKGSPIKKTYIWTLEDKESMIAYLYDEKVDGIITNAGANGRDFTKNALDIIYHSLEFRLAKRNDNIFEAFKK